MSKRPEMAGNGRRVARREAAIAALLAWPTIGRAATAAGVGERTLRRWLSEDDDFRRAYRDARARALTQAIGVLQAAAGEAVEALRAALTDEAAAVRVRAAIAILDRAMTGAELLDLHERLDALEAWAAEPANRWTP